MPNILCWLFNQMVKISFEEILCIGRKYGPHILILFNNFNESSIKSKYMSRSFLLLKTITLVLVKLNIRCHLLQQINNPLKHFCRPFGVSAQRLRSSANTIYVIIKLLFRPDGEHFYSVVNEGVETFHVVLNLQCLTRIECLAYIFCLEFTR